MTTELVPTGGDAVATSTDLVPADGRDVAPVDDAGPLIHEPGIYFGLPAARYHRDRALGSGDMRLLRRNPTSYWDRRINPNHVQRRSRALERGAAMHALVFDGEEVFDSRYMRGPQHNEDMTTPEKAALTKEWNKRAKARGKVALPAEDYDRVVMASRIIELNPDMATVFRNGFAEVSVFWVRDGIRRKARIDYLKVLGIGDLKGVANQHDNDFRDQCRLHVGRYNYHIQLGHYLEARAQVPRFVADGMVRGGHDPDLLGRIAARTDVGWQWVFYCTEGPPDAYSYKVVAENTPFIEVAQRDVEIACARYARFKRQFGAEQWVLIEPPAHLTLDMMPYNFARCSPEELAEYAEWMQQKEDL